MFVMITSNLKNKDSKKLARVCTVADSSLTAFANEADVVVVPDALVALGVRAQLAALLGVAVPHARARATAKAGVS